MELVSTAQIAHLSVRALSGVDLTMSPGHGTFHELQKYHLDRPPSLSTGLEEVLEADVALWRCLASLIS